MMLIKCLREVRFKGKFHFGTANCYQNYQLRNWSHTNRTYKGAHFRDSAVPFAVIAVVLRNNAGIDD